MACLIGVSTSCEVLFSGLDEAEGILSTATTPNKDSHVVRNKFYTLPLGSDENLNRMYPSSDLLARLPSGPFDCSVRWTVGLISCCRVSSTSIKYKAERMPGIYDGSYRAVTLTFFTSMSNK